jgi:hypothetical protein
MSNDTTLALLDLAITASRAYGRDDLADRLTAHRAETADPSYRVMVVGEFKQGKSSLVNALLNAGVCPVDDDIATAVPTFIRHADTPWARIVREADDGTRTDDVDFALLPGLITETASTSGLRAAEVGIPRRLLADGLTIIDTPGVGGLGSAHTAATVAALPHADAIVFVSDASQEFGRPELDFLAVARQACPDIAFVLTKIDLYPEWKRIRDIDLEHLTRLGIDADIMPTSATLRQVAVRTDDRILNAESGYPELVTFLTDRVTLTGSDRAAARTAEVVTDAVDQIDAAFAGEEAALTDPEQIEAMTARFEESRRRAEALRGNAARWQVTLNDGIADLSADFDHRLRARLRSVIREAEDAIDTQDPGEVWPQFEEWLTRRVAHDAAETYVELSARTDALSESVAGHFDTGRGALGLSLDPTTIIQKATELEVRSRVEDNTTGLVGSGLTAMRGSYGGFLMFGMLGQMAGLAMINPATAVIGILMGGKAVRDEKERQLSIRRQQAKATVRQFVDDATFELGKEVRDELRRLQRTLRDHYTLCAEELNRSVAETISSAKLAAASTQAERDKRLADVTAERARLAGLRAQAQTLTGGGR